MQETANGETVSKQFPCNLCGKGYKDLRSLNRHKVNKHDSVKGKRGRRPLPLVDNEEVEEEMDGSMEAANLSNHEVDTDNSQFGVVQDISGIVQKKLTDFNFG